MTEQLSNNTSKNNKRIAVNTLFLYFRMILVMAIGLYSSRVILQVLGIDDYGLFNVVAGVVTVFAFLNTTLATSTQRFLNFEIGRGNLQRVKAVFSNSLLLHILLIVIILFLAETIGLWFVKNKLVIPDDREVAALYVYQFSIIALCVNVFQLPYMAAIIAHERMQIYAYISIIDAIVKLAIVFLLMYIPSDKLIIYGLFYMLSHTLVSLLYIFYSSHKFPEVTFRVSYEKDLFRQMLGFSGWNIIGGAASATNNQGINIILNLFFGTTVNAARGISMQVCGYMNLLVSNFQIAVKPQVVKYYAVGKIEEMTQLVFNAAKASAFLMMLICIPVIVEVESILSVWLGEYPPYAPVFIRIVLFQSIITSMTGNVIMVAHATGYLKKIGIYAGGAQLLVLPISYILLRLGCAAVIPFFVCIIGSLVEVYIELFWMRRYIQFPLRRFYKEVYGRVFSLFALLLIVPYGLHVLAPEVHDIIRMFVVCVVSIVFSSITIFYFGIDKNLRSKVIKFLGRKLHIKD